MMKRVKHWYLKQSEADLRFNLGCTSFLLFVGVMGYFTYQRLNETSSTSSIQSVRAAQRRTETWQELTQDMESFFVLGGFLLVLVLLYFFLFSGDSQLTEWRDRSRFQIIRYDPTDIDEE